MIMSLLWLVVVVLVLFFIGYLLRVAVQKKKKTKTARPEVLTKGRGSRRSRPRQWSRGCGRERQSVYRPRESAGEGKIRLRRGGAGGGQCEKNEGDPMRSRAEVRAMWRLLKGLFERLRREDPGSRTALRIAGYWGVLAWVLNEPDGESFARFMQASRQRMGESGLLREEDPPPAQPGGDGGREGG